MGNKGTVVFTDGKDVFSPAIYLHWNGGPESVYAFLAELDRRKVRADQDYEAARFVQLVGEFFDQDYIGGFSLGISNGPRSDSLEDLGKIQTDLSDNGIYLVNRTNNTLKVRRFHVKAWTQDGITMTEMSRQSVVQEHKEAKQHGYWKGFKEDFANITKGKKIQTY